MTQDVRGLALHLLEAAKKTIEGGGQVPATVVILGDGFKPVTHPLDMSNPFGAYQGVQDVILKAEPDMVAIVSEAWGSANVSRETYKRGDAEKDPQRTELIFVVSGAVNGQFSVFQEFTRDASSGKITWGKLTEIAKDKDPDKHFDCSFFGDAWEIRAAKSATVH